MARGREQRGVEFKRAATWSEYKDKIVKAALAFPNLEGGGYFVVGIKETTPHQLDVDPLSDDQLNSFVHDHVAAYVDPWVDPFVELDVYPIALRAGGNVLVIQFSEFAELPIICKRDGPGLRRGGLYVRATRQVETAELASHAELREILNLATRKMVRQWQQHALEVNTAANQGRAAFDRQLGDF